MKEKELRLAVILTGGVSLTVHMHGVSKELLKLVRASKIYHKAPHSRRQASSYHDYNDDKSRETDTEEVYYELLQEIGKYIDLRILIDVIAGSSAGGVNGIFLAHAVAHDLAIDDHRKMWLQHADVLELMDEDTVAGPWSKIYLEIIMRVFFWRRLKQLAPEKETHTKLRTFLRSRWFSPPFSGKKFCTWLINAFKQMDAGKSGHNSLLPHGHDLTLCVSVTDYEGYTRALEINDPPVINEKAHRHILKFVHKQHRSGEKPTDFGLKGIPGLVFAARATSSIPGAFDPVSVAEIEECCAMNKLSWDTKKTFLKNKLNIKDGLSDGHYYIDGSVVMDKPFAAAIEALSHKAAHREVIRRILYINPLTSLVEEDKATHMPNMFRTLLASSVEIPGSEPIGDDLERVHTLNQQVRLLSDVVAEARPRVSKLVHSLMKEKEHDAPTNKHFQKWRHEAHEAAAKGSGISYGTYLQLKTLQVLSDIEDIIMGFCERTGILILRQDLHKALQNWLTRQTLPFDKKHQHLSDEDKDKWIKIGFLKRYDIQFRIRRLRFVIRRLNELYRLSHKETLSGTDPLDELKTAFFEQIDELDNSLHPQNYSEEVLQSASRLHEALAIGASDIDENLNELMENIGSEMEQGIVNTKTDETFSVMVLNYLGPESRKELIVSYLGFSFFDVLTYPMLRTGEFTELEEVLIDRISPDDAQTLRRGGAETKLKGQKLKRFAAFFNRDYRENDYLWGRLVGAERMVDIVLQSLQEHLPTQNIDRKSIKLRLFDKIIEREADHLKSDPNLIKKMREELEALRA